MGQHDYRTPDFLPCGTKLEIECDLAIEHALDLALCRELEELADQLPKLCSDSQLRKISERLQAASRRWTNPSVNAFLDRLGIEPGFRLIDSIHAEDLTEALWRYWRRRDLAQCECLGYMLRSLFDGRRRAVALERRALGCSDCQSSAID